MAKKPTVQKDRKQGDPKPDFNYLDEDSEYLGGSESTSVTEVDEDAIESEDGFSHLDGTEDDEWGINEESAKHNPNDGTQGVTPKVSKKHVGAIKGDPTRMTSSTPQSEKDEVEPGTIIEKKPRFGGDGLVIRKKISGE
jgi:hypothetical protein